MNLDEQLAMYRQRYSFEAAKADEQNVSPWEGEIESLKQNEEQDMHELWASEIGSDLNTAYSPSRQDYEAFVNDMMGDPIVKKFGSGMEDGLKELDMLIKDPRNPMNLEQAQDLFVKMMQEKLLPEIEKGDTKE